MPTAIHRRVATCRAGADPTLVARLPSGWAVMGDPQVLRGYCLLLPDPVVPDLNALHPAERDQFLADMGRLGDAVLAVTGALRINYAMFGNLEPALHAHVIPRFADEPESLRTAHLWAYDWSQARRFDPARDGDVLRAIRERLTGRTEAGQQSENRPESSADRSHFGRPHHLDLTVTDLDRAVTFYDGWLPYAGFVRLPDCEDGPLWRGEHFELGLQLAKPGYAGPHDRYAPGLHHLAFEAPTPDAVDRLHDVLREQGVAILDPPMRYDRYAPGYYAVFFSDPDGIKLEYVFTPP